MFSTSKCTRFQIVPNIKIYSVSNNIQSYSEKSEIIIGLGSYIFKTIFAIRALLGFKSVIGLTALLRHESTECFLWLPLPVQGTPKRIDCSKQICLAHPLSFKCSIALKGTHLYMFIYSENGGMATLVNDVSLGFKQMCIISSTVKCIYESQSKIMELALNYLIPKISTKN